MKPAYCAALVLALGAALTGQERRPAFKATVSLVALDVTVTHQNQAVTGLTPGNFEVYDNGVKQRLELVLSEQEPLEAWLVIDRSGSVEPHRRTLEEAALAFLDGLSSRDSAALVGFSEQVIVQQPASANLDAVRRAVHQIAVGGYTALYDATYMAMATRQQGRGRGVVVIITDGADNFSWLTPERVAEMAARSDMVFYSVVLAPDPVVSGASGDVYRTERPKNPPDSPQYRFLRRLAADSGGRVMSARWVGLPDAFAEILAEIRTRYLVTYYPNTATAGWHDVEVKLVGASGDVRTRRGYYAAGK